MKLLDAFGGIALAMLALSGLGLSVSASAASYSAAEGSYSRSVAIGSFLGTLDERSLMRGSFPQPVRYGNFTCGSPSDLHALPDFEWSFWTTAGLVRVSIACVAHSP